MAVTRAKPVTLGDLLALDDHDRLEILNGEIVEKTESSVDHAYVERKLGGLVDPFTYRSGSPKGPGGWWSFTEIHTCYDSGEVYCHDLAGWRRERLPARPVNEYMKITPDWVCEIVSPGHEKRDFVDKFKTLQQAAVPHYWLVHPEEKMLIVCRWSKEGYIVVQRATAGEVVRAEPFDAIELSVSELLGVEDEEV